MTQNEKRVYLIEELIDEQSRYSDIEIPEDEYGQKRLLRSLMNVRSPKKVGTKFLKAQDEYLRSETEKKGVTDIMDMEPVSDGIYLWQGDITTIKCDAIVNAANSGMTGCYYPCHGCIDNMIHTFAGIQLRLECADIMAKQGSAEPAGGAKITHAYNLPCKYILHTVGPIITGEVTQEDEELLASCYISCLETADKNNLGSVAFCCISTGEFHFPPRRAAEIAIETVKAYKEKTKSKIEVIFNVFKDSDYEIYRELLR
jgi:O-acetyl-ADP-ribose deacetylase (regulator of RNase III)